MEMHRLMYDLYKPLRNRLRSFALMPSLLTVYQFAQYLQFDKPLPPALRYPGFGLREPIRVGLFEWSLELIARELILNSPDHAPRAMTTWNEFAEVANRVRDIENDLWGHLPNGPALIQYEMVRLAHRQFPWQVRPTARLIASYFKLYNNPRLVDVMRETFGMSARELYQIALALAGHFIENPSIRQPVTNRVNGVDPETVARFMERFSLPLPQLRERMCEMQAYNINWAYAFDPLRTWPMIELDPNSLFCPMPTLLLWRLTDGVYFDLVQHRRLFDRSFGLAFQDLAGEVIRAANPDGRVKVLLEERYGTRQRPRDSVDLIIQDDSASIFVECKASRLKAQAKVDIHDTATIDGELERLAGFVVQVYSTMADALGGAYPHWRPDGSPVFPMVLTLDEWLPSGRVLNETLEASVKAALSAGGLPMSLLTDHPFTLCSLSEFEAAAKAIAAEGVLAVMGAKAAGHEHAWAMMPFLHNRFPRHVRDGRVLFEQEWHELTRGLRG
jgi:hypothetical protein